MLMDWLSQNAVALLNVIMIDVVLAGDNAIIVGLAASQVVPELRKLVPAYGFPAACWKMNSTIGVESSSP